MSLQELHSRLSDFEFQKRSIEAQILQIKRELEKHSSLTKEDKIALYRSLFVGREDVYATYWISGDGLKKGDFPKTATFQGNDYLTLTDAVIQSHLEGKVRIGTYAVKDQSFCSFLAIDLDKSSFLIDARAINTVCLEMGVTPSYEISKSGNGLHIWFFFSQNVRARDARILGDLIITKAMDYSDGIDMKSFDRLFPNQDYVPYDGLGNLIALPLHYGSRNEGKTVFVDIDTLQPYGDQWLYLSSVAKIAPSRLSALIQTYAQSLGAEETLMPWKIKKSTTQRHHLKTVPTRYETLLNHFSTILGELSEDNDRNQLIIDEIKMLQHRKVLVLSERIEHLNHLWHRLKLENIDALLLYGAMGAKMKREQFAQTSDASIILSTSSYIGEGIDIGHLDTVVFTMPISYDERMVQYLGRIGRQGQECLAIDFIDHEVPLLKSSFTKRLKGYKKMGYGLNNLTEISPLSSVTSTGLFG